MKLTLPTQPTVTLVIGASGSGKTHTAAALANSNPAAVVIVVTLDVTRQTPIAASDALNMVHQRCRNRRSTIVDASGATDEHRKAVARIATNHGIPVMAVVMDTPLQLCLDRQHHRPADQRVPAETVRAQHDAMTASLPLFAGEDYAAVHILRPLLVHQPVLGHHCGS